MLHASTLRKNLRNIIADDQHFLHIRFIQTERMKMVVPRRQEQAIIKSLTSVGHSVVSDYSISGMQLLKG